MIWLHMYWAKTTRLSRLTESQISRQDRFMFNMLYELTRVLTFENLYQMAAATSTGLITVCMWRLGISSSARLFSKCFLCPLGFPSMWLRLQVSSVCVCVCARARARACVWRYINTHTHTHMSHTYEVMAFENQTLSVRWRIVATRSKGRSQRRR